MFGAAYVLRLWRDETSPFNVSFLEGGGRDAESMEDANSRISQFFPKNILLSMAPLESVSWGNYCLQGMIYDREFTNVCWPGAGCTVTHGLC